MKSSIHLKMSLIAVITATSLAHAGNDAGHGGGAFICDDPTRSEFLDLYEARESGLNILQSISSVEVQIQKALTKLKSVSKQFKDIDKTYAEVRAARRVPVPTGLDLAWPSDALNKYAKGGCKAKAIMIFHDKKNKHDVDTIDFDSVSLKALPDVEQAAAWLHETIYKFLRKHNSERNSIRTRIIVGLLLSDISENQIASELNRLFPVGACLLDVRAIAPICVRMEIGKCESLSGTFMSGPCFGF